MGGHKKWNRLEEAEDILDQVYEALAKIPTRDLRTDHIWVPSREFIAEIEESRDRVKRYMKRNKINGWAHEHEHPTTD